ncbi:unnamed protein product [Moneuplotes crassus]|uniref:Uncharacterized protein n=1 Tax=Euplotes crassus TaxID=5936 RepID=A0AAD1XZJ4_EUPCR|nr:unnamed protein product [Moneuplotes crassus]
MSKFLNSFVMSQVSFWVKLQEIIKSEDSFFLHISDFLEQRLVFCLAPSSENYLICLLLGKSLSLVFQENFISCICVVFVLEFSEPGVSSFLSSGKELFNIEKSGSPTSCASSSNCWAGIPNKVLSTASWPTSRTFGELACSFCRVSTFSGTSTEQYLAIKSLEELGFIMS